MATHTSRLHVVASIQIDNYTEPHLDGGVPQRSCLSPTLYNLYTHDIPPPLPTAEYISFADDIVQITAGPCNCNAQLTTQNTQ